MIAVDVREVEQLEKDLKTLAKKAFPFAVRDTLNDLAFDARRDYAERAGEEMKLRGPWTVKSMRVDKVRGVMVSKMVSVSGSIEPYMESQESGAKESAKGRYGVPAPAVSKSRIKNRPKTPARNRFGGLTGVVSLQKGSRQVRNAGAIAYAARKGGGIVFLNLGKRKGLYRVSPGKKRAAKIRKVWDLSKKSITITKNPMLQFAKDKAMKGLFGHYRENMIHQLRRAGIKGYV